MVSLHAMGIYGEQRKMEPKMNITALRSPVRTGRGSVPSTCPDFWPPPPAFGQNLSSCIERKPVTHKMPWHPPLGIGNMTMQAIALLPIEILAQSLALLTALAVFDWTSNQPSCRADPQAVILLQISQRCREWSQMRPLHGPIENLTKGVSDIDP